MRRSAKAKLLIYRMSQQMAIGGIYEAIANPKRMNRYVREAETFVAESIQQVRQAEDADPNWTDEEIAQMIVDRLIERVCRCQQAPHLPTCPARKLANG